MSDDKKRPQLFGWRQRVVMAVAMVAGLGLNGYRTYRNEGGLDASWFVGGIFTVALIGVIVFFVMRHARKPEREK
jgi:FtsH-binding integral membrane protein